MSRVVVAVVVACLALGACNERQTIVFNTIAERDDFAQKRWIPSTLTLGSSLTWHLDTNACTIKSSSMPVGTIEGNLLIVGDGRWLIVSTEPVVLQCTR